MVTSIQVWSRTTYCYQRVTVDSPCDNRVSKNIETMYLVEEETMTTDEKLDKILEILTRMEQRQTTMKQEIEDIEEHEPPKTGSFGTIDRPKI